MKKKVSLGVFTMVYALMAIGIVLIIYNSGNYPAGSDTMCHVYKGDILYRCIEDGNWYPLYDNFWYNGVQMMRYWAPLPVYFLALCQLLAGGNAITGYLIFVGIIFFAGALVWLYIGIKKERMFLGSFLGAIWFFMPNNLYALFVEGNLPRSLSMVLLPLFVYFIYEFLFENNWKSVKKIIPVFAAIALCHVGYAGMLALALLIFLAIYKIMYKEKGKCITVIASILLPFLVIGIWLVGSLIGGITSTDSSQVMQTFFQDAIISLNPFNRYTNGYTNFYYGLSAFLIALFGIVCSRKKSAVGFWTALIIFICTTSSMYPVLKKLPGSQYLWMLRFISIALCMILYSFLVWKSLKKSFVIICCVLLVADIIPSLGLIYSPSDGTTAYEKMDNRADTSLITKAKDITTQRIALMDESTMESMAQYLLSDYGENKLQCTFGAGWQSAATSRNIVQLNEALSQGCYLYMFDRALEMGNDTVLIKLSQLKYKEQDVQRVIEDATRNGYNLVDKNEQFLLFNYETYDNFGVITKYDGIGIGTSASLMALNGPYFKETESTNLEDYSFEELSKYKVVYLAGFTYNNKEKAEKLLLDLSESGVRIIINGDGIPVNDNNNLQELFGVTCNSILFENGYPLLYTDKGETESYLFDTKYSKWKTVYFNGLDNEKGYFYENGVKVNFLGTVKNQNIIFVGLNLTYHYSLTHDEQVGEILNETFGNILKELPERKIVPLKIAYFKNSIEINSYHDKVNTTLAYHDIFESDEEITSSNNLTYVNNGTTKIDMRYPYLLEGAVTSAAGIALSILFIISVKKRYSEKGTDDAQKI